jgi:hypothetical protein
VVCSAHLSPEYARTGKYSEKAEVFAFGIVMLEVLTGRLQLSPVELCDHYLYGDGEELGPAALDIRAGQAPQELALSLCKLTRDCLEDRHQRRVGLTAVMRQLNELVTQHCVPIVEEGLLSAAREDMERLRQAVHLGERGARGARGAREQRPAVECIVCMDPSPESRGLRCGGGEGGEGAESHFTCAGCVDQQTRITAEGMGALGVRMGVPCCGFRCGALYNEQALAVQCTPAVYVLYTQAKQQRLLAAAERAVEERYAVERLRLAALSEADRQALLVRTHITEDILTLKCPHAHCGKAFLDFDACFALCCRDQAGHGCGSFFCGFCFTLCGSNADTHQHVAQCAHNTNPGREVFGPVANFEQAQRRRRLRLLREYLGPMAVQQRDRALQDCEAELRDLGYTRAELLGADEQGPIAVLVVQLRDGTEREKCDAAFALWGLAANAANDVAIAAAGAFPLLIALLREGTVEGKSNAASALGNLAVDAANQVTIVAAGAIPPLIALLRDGTVDGKKKAAGALGNLTVNAANQVAVAAAGAIPLLIALLRDGTVEGRIYAACALCNLTASSGNDVAIAAAGAIPPLIALLRDGTVGEETHMWAAVALWNLAENAANAVTIKREGLRLLRSTVANGPAELAAKCRQILARLDRLP